MRFSKYRKYRVEIEAGAKAASNLIFQDLVPLLESKKVVPASLPRDDSEYLDEYVSKLLKALLK